MILFTPHVADGQDAPRAGSGFGGQFPLAFPDEDLILVINQWNILPNQRQFLPLRPTLTRVLDAIVAHQ